MMKFLYFFTLILSISIAGLQSNSVLAEEQFRPVHNLERLAAFSPRKYCQSGGGQVAETGQAHIYLCCYTGKNKCIATDTKKSISWILPVQGPVSTTTFTTKK